MSPETEVRGSRTGSLAATAGRNGAEAHPQSEPGATSAGGTSPTRPGSIPDPAREHAAWTLAWMLREAIENLRAERSASHDDDLGEWPLPPNPLRVATMGAERVALSALPPGADALHLSSAEAGPAGRAGSFDLVLLTLEDRLTDAERDGLLTAAATAAGTLCAIECGDLHATVSAARAAGFGSIGRAEPPLDAASRYVLGERSLLLARP